MRRPVLLGLPGVLLLAAGFGAGYWLRQRAAPPPATNAPAAAVDTPAPTPKVVIEPDELAQDAAGPNTHAFRYSGGPVTFRLRVYLDFETKGVKKRAVVRAEDFRLPLPVAAPAQGPTLDLTSSSGSVALELSNRAISYTHRRKLETSAGPTVQRVTNRVPFEWRWRWSLPTDVDVPTLFFDDTVRATGLQPAFALTSAVPGSRSVGRLPSRTELLPGSETLLYSESDEFGHVVVLTAVVGPLTVPNTRDGMRAEAATRQAETQANPASGPAWAQLAAALGELARRFPEVSASERLTLREQAVAAARQALRLEPGNIDFRVQLRDLLLELMYARNDSPATAATIPALIDEVFVLVPPLFDTYEEVARFLALHWKPPDPWPAGTPRPKWEKPPERAKELIRTALAQHQDDPVFVREKLAVVRSRRFAETFGPDARAGLEDDLKRWLMREFDDRSPDRPAKIPLAE